MPEISSPAGTTVSTIFRPTSWWAKSKSHPEWDTAIRVVTFPRRIPVEAKVWSPIGREEDYTTRGTRGARSDVVRGTLTVRTLGEDEHDAVLRILTAQEPFLVQNVHGEQWWLDVVSDITPEDVKAEPKPWEEFPTRFAHLLSFDVTTVREPA